ncbi:hypothetical protein [Paenibacillus sp. ISL-20]|uniref:hypothetical protein n=1 Tax=Paenibacillus sp. ISL-20 TaxID=2819163 RepID=UPI0020354003|nr:hypothetical protein [Paenibacillus sp. ISL-20]
MTRLGNLGVDKTTIMYRLADSIDLCKALYYNEPNFLDQPDIADTGELFYNNIFPFSRIPSLAEEGKSYLTMSFRDFKKVNNRFKSGYIYLHAFTHAKLIRTDHGFLRYDFIISEIDKLMNEQRGLGIGKTEFYKMDEYYVNEQYMGMYVAYKIYESN